MNGDSTTTNAAQSLKTGLGSTLAPVKNVKSITIQQLDHGFLIGMQKVDTYGITNDVSLDLESAVKIAEEYFAS